MKFMMFLTRHVGPRRVLIAAGIAVLMVASTADASTNVFGPTTYVSKNGPPHHFEAAFTALPQLACGARIVYTLVVRNGTDRPPATSAQISLNGAAIFDQSDFNPSVTELSAPIRAVASNKLSGRSQRKARLCADDYCRCRHGVAAGSAETIRPHRERVSPRTILSRSLRSALHS